jgi:hypothetical protein
MGINLIKHVHNLYVKKYKIPIKENFNYLSRRDIPCSSIEKLDLVKMSFPANLIYRLNATPSKVPVKYFIDIDNLILKFIWKGKGPRIGNTVTKKTETEKQNWRTHTIQFQD